MLAIASLPHKTTTGKREVKIPLTNGSCGLMWCSKMEKGSYFFCFLLNKNNSRVTISRPTEPYTR